MGGVPVTVLVGVAETVKVLVGVGVRDGVAVGVMEGSPSVPVTERVYGPPAHGGHSAVSQTESMKKK